MTAPSMITTRRFSSSLRLKLHVVFAKAWEALAETYRTQATEFVRRTAPWFPVEEALDRYFHDVGVPASMAETVRARALIALAPLIDQTVPLSVEPEEPSTPWRSLKFDRIVSSLRQRAQYVEETNLQCRLAACIAKEALAVTHVRMALETAEALDGELPPDEAIMHYVRTFSLPALEAQIIFQRAMAQWAERHVANPEAPVLAVDRAARCASAAPAASIPKLELVAMQSIGLRLRALM